MSVLDLFKLDGKVALVTGGGQGIGRAYALALAEAGADVAVADINERTGRHVADEIVALGRRSVFVKTDVTRPEEVEALVTATVADADCRGDTVSEAVDVAVMVTLVAGNLIGGV